MQAFCQLVLVGGGYGFLYMSAMMAVTTELGGYCMTQGFAISGSAFGQVKHGIHIRNLKLPCYYSSCLLLLLILLSQILLLLMALADHHGAPASRLP